MMGTGCRKKRRSGGVTLLEVLVALSILATAVTVVFQLFSADLRAISLSDNYMSVAIRAESRMSEILENEKLAEGGWSETTAEGYRIDVAITKALDERTRKLPVELLEIALTVHWKKGGRDKEMTFRSMKMILRKV